MLRITFSYLIFISLTAFASATLNAYGHFAAPALAPLLLNICLISAALWFGKYFERPVMALAWAVFLAGILQLLLQLPFLARRGLLPKPSFSGKDEGVKRILRLMLPAVFGVSVTQINILIDTVLASFLDTGSISWLYYSDRLLEFPIGIFGIALATVMLPSLSSSIAKGEMETYQGKLDWSLRWVFFIGLPCSAGLIALAEPILNVLFFRGAFGTDDIIMSARSLVTYTVGMTAFVLIKILAAGFYARQDTRTPVRIAVIAMISNIILNLILIFPLKHAGLALATSFAAIINATLLFRALRHRQLYHALSGWPAFLKRSTSAALLMGGSVWYVAAQYNWLAHTGLHKALYLLFCISLGIFLYFALLWLGGMRPHHLRLQNSA